MKIGFSTYLYYPKYPPSFNGASETQKEEAKRRADKVSSLLEKAIAENRKITVTEIAKETGCSKDKIWYLFQRNTKINALWQRIQSGIQSEGQKEKERKMEKVRLVLQKAKDSNERLELKEVAKRADVSTATANHYVQDPSLNSLWYWVRSKEHTSYTEEEIQEQTLLIQKQLELAIEHKKAILIKEIADTLSLDSTTVQNRINANETLTTLRNQTLAFADKNYKLEVRKIKEVLKNAKEKGLKITTTYISDCTSIPRSIVEARIRQNTSLNKLFEHTRAHRQSSKEESNIQNKKIEAVLNETALNNGQKMTYGEVSTKAGINITAGNISRRIEGDSKLSALWEQVRAGKCPHTSKDEIADKIKEVENILIEAYNSGKKLTSKQLLNMTGLTKSTLFSHIGKSELLTALWELTSANPNGGFTKDEIEVQNIIIEQILEQRIKDAMIPTFNQIAEYLDMQGKSVQRRIEDNQKLSALYQKARQAENQ